MCNKILIFIFFIIFVCLYFTMSNKPFWIKALKENFIFTELRDYILWQFKVFKKKMNNSYYPILFFLVLRKILNFAKCHMYAKFWIRGITNLYIYIFFLHHILINKFYNDLNNFCCVHYVLVFEENSKFWPWYHFWLLYVFNCILYWIHN